MRRKGIQSGAVTRVVCFDQCFLGSSFGLVGRAAAVIQPRQVVYCGSKFQENIQEINVLETARHSVQVNMLAKYYFKIRTLRKMTIL